MATVTITATAQPSPFNPRSHTRHAPARSSPLACTQSAPAAKSSVNGSSGLSGIASQRSQSFPTSRPIRPFASIAPRAAASKPVKNFELPEAFKSGCFMLNLTQAEFSRQE